MPRIGTLLVRLPVQRSLFTPDFGVFTTILKGLILIAFMPALISLLFSIRTGMRPARAMTLYFAYGANMERAAMRKRCPGASALGPRAAARLALCDRATATARSRRRRDAACSACCGGSRRAILPR